MQAKHIILSLAVVGLLLLAVPIEGQKAQAFPVPDALSRVVGAPKATCTPRGCRYEVTCESPGEAGCIFTLALSRGVYLTKIPTCILDEDGEDNCPPEAKGVYLGPGETKMLKLRLLRSGRQAVKDRLKRGDRTIKGGWEVFRLDLLGPESYEEAEAWDAVPGFFTYPVLGGWLVFQSDQDTKIRLKR
jgi:hypothetical protein